MHCYLGVGHGLTPAGTLDPGAVAPLPDGTTEYSLNFPVVEEAHQALSRSGIPHFTETSAGPGHDPDYRGAVDAVNAGGYDLAVEVHFDSANAPDAEFGIYVSDAGRKLTDAVQARVAAAGIAVKPNYKDVRGLWFIEGTNCPAAIIECGATHQRDAATLATLGEAVAAGICDFYGVPFVASGPAAPLPQPSDPPVVITDAVGVACPTPGTGTWTAAADGGVYARGGAPFFGSMGGHPLAGPIVAIIGHGPGGYWLIGADGGIFAFGDAPVIGPWGPFATEYRAGTHHMVGGARVGEKLVQVANDGDLYLP